MSQLLKQRFEKVGAIFEDAQQAINNRNSLIPAETQQNINDCHDDLLVQGILLVPVFFEWDQDTFIVCACKLVSSVDAYMEARTFDPAPVVAEIEAAGWTHLPPIIIDN